MRLPRNAKIFRGQLDVAPFAGVFFLLLMFLTLQSALVHTPGVKIALPESSEALPGPANPALVVAIDASDRIYFEGQVTTTNKLLAKLKAAVAQSKDPVALILQADKQGKLEKAVELMNLAAQAGIHDRWIATEPKGLLNRTNSVPSAP